MDRTDNLAVSRPRALGVGILGAGPVVQAIHLPTLARLTDLFDVTHVMDVNAEVAASVAGRAGASSSTSMEELLADESVDVVAVCSPAQFHATQVIAAMRAGKKAVLCEKPFANSREEAEEIAAVSLETGVPVIVGAMHAFDPGWIEGRARAAKLAEDAHTIRSSIVIPFNDRFEDWATQVVGRVPMSPPEGELDANALAGMMFGGVMGLAIHDLPLIRTYFAADAPVEVMSAETMSPFGYSIVLRSGERVASLYASIHGHWKPEWVLEVTSLEQNATFTFTPSYVHAGSAVAELANEQETVRLRDQAHNGYEGEWRALYARVAGDITAVPGTDSLIADLTFAVDIAERAAALVRAAATDEGGAQ